MTAHLTIPMDDEDNARLQTIADFRDQSIEAMVSDAVRELIEYDARVRTAVEKGLQDVRDGRTIPHEDVVARALARRLARQDASKA